MSKFSKKDIVEIQESYTELNQKGFLPQFFDALATRQRNKTFVANTRFDSRKRKVVRQAARLIR